MFFQVTTKLVRSVLSALGLAMTLVPAVLSMVTAVMLWAEKFPMDFVEPESVASLVAVTFVWS
jgi:hypothetical protein